MFLERLSWGSESRWEVLSSILTFRNPHIYFAFQYKGEYSQFEKLYIELFDSITVFIKFHTYICIDVVFITLILCFFKQDTYGGGNNNNDNNNNNNNNSYSLLK